jgi:hypothetical protein
VLHGIPTSATYEETLQALEDHFGDRHFPAAYRSHQKTRTQKAEESLREFATAIEQLALSAYPTLPDEHTKREAGRAFADGVEDPDVKIQLLLGEKTVNEALTQALELQAVFLAARPQKMRRHFGGTDRLPPEKGMQDSQDAGPVESQATSGVTALTERIRKMTGAGDVKISQAETRGE